MESLAVIQIRSTTGVLILFLVLSPHLVLLVKTLIIFRLLNEVCIQSTFRKKSETTALVKTILGDPGAVSRVDKLSVVKVYCKVETSKINHKHHNPKKSRNYSRICVRKTFTIYNLRGSIFAPIIP